MIEATWGSSPLLPEGELFLGEGNDVFRWWNRRVYRGEVLTQLKVMTLMLGNEEKMLDKHSGIAQAIRKNFDNGVTAPATATFIAAALMADAIERNDDNERKQIVEQLLAQWSKLDPVAQRGISRQLGDGTLNQDMLLTRCQWLLLRGQDLLVEKKIEMQDFRILKDHIYGPLKGEKSIDRMIMRLSDSLDDILGPNPQ